MHNSNSVKFRRKTIFCLGSPTSNRCIFCPIWLQFAIVKHIEPNKYVDIKGKGIHFMLNGRFKSKRLLWDCYFRCHLLLWISKWYTNQMCIRVCPTMIGASYISLVFSHCWKLYFHDKWRSHWQTEPMSVAALRIVKAFMNSILLWMVQFKGKVCIVIYWNSFQTKLEWWLMFAALEKAKLDGWCIGFKSCINYKHIYMMCKIVWWL